MPYRILLLDIDGVLSKHGEPVRIEVINKLKELSKKLEIIPISGKNVSYLEGLFRGIGIIPKCIVGENGGCIYFPKELREYTYFHEKPKLIDAIEKIKKDIVEKVSENNLRVWFRENKVAITCLTDNIDVLEELVKDLDLTYFKMLRYPFAIQIIPKDLDKGWATSKLSDLLDVPLKFFIAIGDDERDVPMFKRVGLSISIGNNKRAKESSSLNFSSVIEALNYIKDEILQKL